MSAQTDTESIADHSKPKKKQEQKLLSFGNILMKKRLNKMEIRLLLLNVK